MVGFNFFLFFICYFFVGDARDELERLATEWNLGGSVRRLLEALDLRQEKNG